MEKERLVIVGGGMAATRFVEEIVARAPGRFAVTVIGEEPRLAYNRVLLSPVLAGEMSLADIELKPAGWWRDAGVEFLQGRRVVGVDAARRVVTLDDGRRRPYGKLVLATGSQALRLDIPNAALDGVHVFRSVADVEALAALGRGRRVIVVGGGLLGLEAAYGLARRGAQTTLVHVLDRLMERQLDADGAAILRRRVEEKGVAVRLDASIARIIGDGHVAAAEFADGARLDADAVIFAVGVRANADLARAAGLAVQRGVVVDDTLATSDPHVFAIGECAEHRGVCYGLVEPAYEQARTLAARLCGMAASYDGSVVATNLKVSGVRVFSAGDCLGPAALVCRDPRRGVYRKLVLEGDRLVGAILIGETAGAADCLDFIRSGASVADCRNELAFGEPLQKAA